MSGHESSARYGILEKKGGMGDRNTWLYNTAWQKDHEYSGNAEN